MKRLALFLIPAILVAQEPKPTQAHVEMLLAKIVRLEQQLAVFKGLIDYYERLTPAVQREAAAREARSKECGGEVNEDGSCKSKEATK